MKPELQEKLKKQIPFLKDTQIYCGNSWYELIIEMCDEISQADLGNWHNTNFSIFKIYEKYGTMQTDYSALESVST